ncbi:RNA polymerase sigma factor [Marinoscillum pacificum]|uniref:RNA polymerase sigma factor n=1 Tax=Marinoscillum pacificum TaxID=392723 RepID=UPI002157AC75|nr:RNA polymerase sigma factor [Marinoscillum pacificum]
MNSTTFRETILPLSQKIYPVAARMLGNRDDASDAVQEVMLKLWKQRKKLSKHPNITGFVVLTARNHCLDLLKKRQIKLVPDAIDINTSSNLSSHSEIEWKELNGIIGELIQELPEQQGEVLAMRDLDGLEFAEIAAATGLKIEHIRVLLSRARKHLSTQLKKIYSYE